jgi:hypothetical protein
VRLISLIKALLVAVEGMRVVENETEFESQIVH